MLPSTPTPLLKIGQPYVHLSKYTCAHTHPGSHWLLQWRIECSRVERVEWGWRGVVGGKGKVYFEVLAEQDEHVGIDVMEGDGIKGRWSTLKSSRKGRRKIFEEKKTDDKRKRSLNDEIRRGEGGDEGSPISFLPTEPTSLPRLQQWALWLSKKALIMHSKAHFMLL